MHEDTINIRAEDGKDIFCSVMYAHSAAQKSDKAVMMVHGVTGYPFSHLLQTAARFFAGKGYDVYRPALYWSEENNRTLSECTTSMHTADMQSVMDVLRPQYRKLYAAGHSMAGTSLLSLGPNADAYSFWDSDYSPWRDTWMHARFNEGLDAYLLGHGTENIVSKAMVEEAKNTPESRTIELLNRIIVPSQVIVAEFGQAASGAKIFEHLKCRKEFIHVAEAGHIFAENDSASRLSQFTFDWFESH